MILGQQAGQGLEFAKIQIENCLHGRESPCSKELKRVYRNITELGVRLPDSQLTWILLLHYSFAIDAQWGIYFCADLSSVL